MLGTSTGYKTFININGLFAIKLVLIKIKTIYKVILIMNVM